MVEALSSAVYCPVEWYKAGLGRLAGLPLLNQTIIFAGCYGEAHAIVKGVGTGPSATPGLGVTKGGATQTGRKSSDVHGRGR